MIFEKLIPYRRAIKFDIFKNFISKQNFLNDDHLKAKYDIKLHSLSEGECPCRPIWHYDGTNNPLDDDLVRYELYLEGDSICRTKFFSNEPVLSTESLGNERLIHKEAFTIEKATTDIIDIEYGKRIQYLSNNLHRATHATTAGERLLIRIKYER